MDAETCRCSHHIHPRRHGQLRRKLQPGADPAFDKVAFIGEEDSEDHAADVVDVDISAEISAHEDRDAERTDSHEQPSNCTRTPNEVQVET